MHSAGGAPPAEWMVAILTVVAASVCSGVVGADPSQAAHRSPATVDLSKAVVVTAGSTADAVERQAALMLRWEVRKRTGLELKEAGSVPADATPAIVIGSRERMPALPAGLRVAQPVMKEGKPAAEGYVVMVDTGSRPGATVCCVGNDHRGTLFAVGKLLRTADWGEGSLKVPADLSAASAPEYPVRGMQLGYRRLNDTFDAWDVGRYAQYIRDLIIFGNNSVELIPPSGPGVEWIAIPDPLMPLNTWDMTAALSALLDAYDMDVWLWLPLEDNAADDPQRRAATLVDRDELFAACKRIDDVFVPAGDPGNTPPQAMIPYLRDLAALLHKHHPNAKLWVSSQKWGLQGVKYFTDYMRANRPDWLAGMVWGPSSPGSPQQARQMVPPEYGLRLYPDITHALRCQYPFPYLDEPWAQAYARQPIQPRPTQYAHICRTMSPGTMGAVCYSDGTGDDVNKIIWDSLLWDPQADVREALRDYGRCFFGPEFADEVADGELMLERNWVGSAATNPQVAQTFAHWRAMEKRATPKQLANWRFQQGLIRAYGDMFIQTRVRRDQALLERAYAELRKAPQVGPEAAMTAAETILAEADPSPLDFQAGTVPKEGSQAAHRPQAAHRLTSAPQLRDRIHELGGELFKSIGMQLGMKEYGSSDGNRGAQLDNNDRPVSDCPWLAAQFPEIRKLPTREAQLAAIEQWLNWTNPGPGGFYDDLGNHANLMDPHLVRSVTWEQDPEFMLTPDDAHQSSMYPMYQRLSWMNQAQSYMQPLRLRYTGLDRNATYILKATYGGRGKALLQLYLDGQKFGDPVESDPQRPTRHEFEVAKAMTADGVLDVAWDELGEGGAKVAEAWLIRKP